MVTERKEGLATALEAVDLGEPPSDEAEQLELAGVPLAPAATADGSKPLERGPGRPVGAKNKRTEAWVEFMLGQYRSPLVVLAETFSRTIGELAIELECDKVEAFKIQMAAAKELAPYVHQRMPQAIELPASNPIAIIIGDVVAGSDAAAAAGEMGVDIELVKNPEENQEVSEIEPEKSDDEKSDDEAK